MSEGHTFSNEFKRTSSSVKRWGQSPENQHLHAVHYQPGLLLGGNLIHDRGETFYHRFEVWGYVAKGHI